MGAFALWGGKSAVRCGFEACFKCWYGLTFAPWPIQGRQPGRPLLTYPCRPSGPLAGRWGGLGPITCLGSGRGLWTQRRRPGDQAAQGLGADDGRQNYRQNLAAGDGWEASKPAPPGYQALSRAPPRQLRIRLAMLFRWGARPQASLIRAHISTGGVPASASCTASTRTSGG